MGEEWAARIACPARDGVEGHWKEMQQVPEGREGVHE